MHPSPLSQPRSESAEASRRPCPNKSRWNPGGKMLWVQQSHVGCSLFQSMIILNEFKWYVYFVSLMDSVGAWAVGSFPSSDKYIAGGFGRIGSITNSSNQLNIEGMMVCCNAVRAMDPITTSTSNKYQQTTMTLKWPSHWKSGNIGRRHRDIHCAESHQHEHNEHVTWKHKKFTMFIGEIQKWFWNLKNIHFSFNVVQWSSVTFQLQPCDSSPSKPTWHCLRSCSCKVFSGISTPEAWVNFSGGQSTGNLRQNLGEIKIKVGFTKSDQYRIIIYNISIVFIQIHPQKQKKKELSRSGSIFRKNKKKEKRIRQTSTSTADSQPASSCAPSWQCLPSLGTLGRTWRNWPSTKTITSHLGKRKLTFPTAFGVC